jgi:hypothetical protein
MGLLCGVVGAWFVNDKLLLIDLEYSGGSSDCMDIKFGQ